MGKYGPSLDLTMQTADNSAPGAPALVTSPVQDGNKGDVEVLVPSTDFSGDPLTGLTRLSLCTTTLVNGENPLLGLSMEQALEVPGVQTVHVDLTDADAGKAFHLVFPVIRAGVDQAIKIACTD